MSSLKQKTVSGIKWTSVSVIAQRILAIGTTVILARLLGPADFGLFALAMMVIDGFGIFRSLGFDSALVRKQEDLGKAYNTAFLLMPLAGMVIFVLLFFSAPFAASFLNSNDLVRIIRVLGIIFFISCFSKIPETIIYKEMNFRAKAFIEFSGALIFSAIALILAFRGIGVWSLVYAYIGRIFVQGILQWVLAGWSPKFDFDLKVALEMFHFGKFILGSAFLKFMRRCVDKVIIGKLLGTTMLGFYSISFNIANILNENFLGRFSKIMFPAFSKIQNDNDQMRRIFIKIIGYVSVFIFPFGLLLFFYSKGILLVLFGEKWLPAANLLRVLSLAVFTSGLAVQMEPVLLAKGKSKFDFWVTFFQTLFFVALIIPLVKRYGLIGSGCALFFSSLAGFWIGFIRARIFLSIRLIDYYHALRLAFKASLGMLLAAAVFWPLSSFFGFPYIFTAPVSIGVYVWIVYMLDKDFFKKLLALAKNQGN